MNVFEFMILAKTRNKSAAVATKIIRCYIDHMMRREFSFKYLDSNSDASQNQIF